MRKLFGTDGVRGIANLDLTPELAFKVAFCASRILAPKGRKASVLVGRDTRPSGEMLEAAIRAGVCSSGADVFSVGIMPTAAVAYLVKKHGFDLGIVISASHNPVEYNGIKLIGTHGFKISDELEERVEEDVFSDGDVERPLGAQVGRCREFEAGLGDYLDHLLSMCDFRLDGLKLAIDCANGAAAVVAPILFERLGASVVAKNTSLSGEEINEKCGSTNPDFIRNLTLSTGSDMGCAFDGDADRVIFCDAQGNILDGDHVLALCAPVLALEGKLRNMTVVTTEMANLGLEEYLASHGIRMERTRVGDRYVLEEMIALGCNFGGEQSGHIIFLDHNTTGDGLITAIQVLRIFKNSSQRFADVKNNMRKFPQLLVSVKVANKDRVMESDRLNVALDEIRRSIHGTGGRVIVRKSGTEPVIRVMVESSSFELAKKAVAEIEALVKAVDEEVSRLGCAG